MLPQKYIDLYSKNVNYQLQILWNYWKTESEKRSNFSNNCQLSIEILFSVGPQLHGKPYSYNKYTGMIEGFVSWTVCFIHLTITGGNSTTGKSFHFSLERTHHTTQPGKMANSPTFN